MRFATFQQLFFAALCCGLSACSQSPATWWSAVNSKAREIATVEANYHALQAEHEHLKKEFYVLEDEVTELRAKVHSIEDGEHNLKATGTPGGRSISSITYEVPKGLRAEDALALAYEHFTEQRFAEAAATFDDLFRRPEAAAVGDAWARYTAGVTWFKLGNTRRAKENFDEAMNSATGEQREKIHKKVDLWMRAIDRKKRGGGTLGG